MATLVCRVQLLDDTDPFNSTNFPEPTRPPLYTFREDIPLATQLAGVHRLLRAPQKVLRMSITTLVQVCKATGLSSIVKEMACENLESFALFIGGLGVSVRKDPSRGWEEASLDVHLNKDENTLCFQKLYQKRLMVLENCGTCVGLIAKLSPLGSDLSGAHISVRLYELQMETENLIYLIRYY
ncbi:hypothetical protein WISP_64592 [Willisornis vidua]|uniref:FHOD1 N-terminal GTPase-binding domain-containing protein n=1 Tax=Willisornis vidua TaxID=1566151 RepID=A0ABQ9DFB0_9PASS|nr:hypothetical protein WISP_64592 [Willisornis vidua]